MLSISVTTMFYKNVLQECFTRLAARKRDISEATYEQYNNQKKSFDAFTETESAHLITVNNENPGSLEETITKLRDLFVATT